MATTLKDITGQRFGRLVVIERNGSDQGGQVKWLSQCDCGNQVTVNGSSLRRGKTKSCGCLTAEIVESLRKTGPHGESRAEKRARIESASYLSESLAYDSETGVLTWKNLFPGRAAGTIVKARRSAAPYVKVALEGIDFKAHRLAWVMMTGARPAPSMHIDHIDGDPTNNRWSNLRLCEPKQNARNAKKPKNNSAGFKGVSRSGYKFRAYICVDRKQINLGSFDTPEEAHAAYRKAAQNHFGEYACLNR